MVSTRQAYSVYSASEKDDELVQAVNSVLYSIADRLDKIEGIRGEAKIESNLDMDDNTIGNVNIDATDITAETITVEDITMTGDIFFTDAHSGLTYGEISAEDNSIETNITSPNVDSQITIFDTNGHSHNVTSDHANDHLLVERAGHYLVICSATIGSIAGAASKFEVHIMKNNGSFRVVPHAERNIAGGTGAAGVISLSGFAEFAVDDTVEVWMKNQTNSQNYVVEDISLAIVQIGGV